MRRIILLLMVAAIMAVLSAAPAFAGVNGTVGCTVHSTLECTDAQLDLGGNIT